jgi:hypothetical protein
VRAFLNTHEPFCFVGADLEYSGFWNAIEEAPCTPHTGAVRAAARAVAVIRGLMLGGNSRWCSKPWGLGAGSK